jgi:hypothetical protein
MYPIKSNAKKNRKMLLRHIPQFKTNIDTSTRVSKLKTRAVTLYVFGISEHTRATYVSFVFASVLFPLRHVIESGNKLLASNPLSELFAAVTSDSDRFDLRMRRSSS